MDNCRQGCTCIASEHQDEHPGMCCDCFDMEFLDEELDADFMEDCCSKCNHEVTGN